MAVDTHFINDLRVDIDRNVEDNTIRWVVISEGDHTVVLYPEEMRQIMDLTI